MRRTKIIATIGPASRDPGCLEALVRSGMDVARLNFSHGEAETHAENARRVREAAETVGRPVALQVDLQGPKYRVGETVEGGVRVADGSDVTLTTRSLVGERPDAVPVQNEELPDLVGRGDRILIDDGMIELRVLETSSDDIRTRVFAGGTIESNKGINLPGVSPDLPSITDKDRRDLERALAWDVDWVALSFVRAARDIHALRRAIEARTDRFVPIMAKIEKPEALERLDEIVAAADAVMVARGDLGIEIPAERVPMAQKRIIERCNEVGVPVVTATQMLDSMIRHRRPTRAEASDVANAILDGTDAVMLSGETAIGRYPLEALETMVRIVNQVESERPASPVRPFRPMGEDIGLLIARALGRAARRAAEELEAAAVIAITSSGYTAGVVSRYRPDAPILAVTPDEGVRRRLQLYWGVTPLAAPRTPSTDEMIANALEAVRREGLVSPGDVVAIMAGTAGSEPGTTDLLRIQVIE